MAVVGFVAGLVFLVVGAEALVRGASRAAAALGVSPLVIGLTVVALGTSSPELAVSVKAALSGQAGIAVGNVVGSNIFNVLFILGLSALFVPLSVSQQLVRIDVPLMIGVSVGVLAFSLDGRIGRAEGTVLVAGLASYLGLMIYLSRRESEAVREEYARQFGRPVGGGRPWAADGLRILGGLGLLVIGSRWLVGSAVAFARYLGVSELVIGLTIVSAGTSLPEVVTSVVAAARGERDIAVGNAVGSNLFNLLGVLGTAAVLAPGGMEVPPSVIRFDLPVMIAVAFACLPVFATGGVISRGEGALLLGYQAAYTLYLILAAVEHEALPQFSGVMLGFVLPLTVVTLLV